MKHRLEHFGESRACWCVGGCVCVCVIVSVFVYLVSPLVRKGAKFARALIKENRCLCSEYLKIFLSRHQGEQ